MSDSILLPWTTRGVKYPTRGYLATVALGDGAPPRTPSVEFGLTPQTPLTDAVPIMQRLRRQYAPQGPAGIEYGCFDHDGTVLEDPGLRVRRQIRNILYYTIRDYFATTWGRTREGLGIAPTADDPVPESPEGSWAVLTTEACPHLDRVRNALAPLVAHRQGELLVIPRLDPPRFLREWLAPRASSGELPRYLLLCDTCENLPLEYQFILNAIGTTGRLWLDDAAGLDAYVDKVLRAERGELASAGRSVIACPDDDPVMAADRRNIIDPLVGPSLEPLLGRDCTPGALLDRAASARLLALYCHGVAVPLEDWEAKSALHGALLLQFDSTGDHGVVSAADVSRSAFVPGGVLFTPACMTGGTMSSSDYSAWIDPEGLPGYMGAHTQISAITSALLASPVGPAAVLAHFDVSMGSGAPMYNAVKPETNLQSMLHAEVIGLLAAGATVGRASKPFRWATGAYYAQAIYVFGQLTGTYPYFGTSGTRKTVGMAVSSMNKYHVTATDMRNFIVLGDPAVRVPPHQLAG